MKQRRIHTQAEIDELRNVIDGNSMRAHQAIQELLSHHSPATERREKMLDGIIEISLGMSSHTPITSET